MCHLFVSEHKNESNINRAYCVMIEHLFYLFLESCYLFFSIHLSDLFSLSLSVSLSLGHVQRSGIISVINGEGRAGILCPGQQHTLHDTSLRAAVSMTTPEKSDDI